MPLWDTTHHIHVGMFGAIPPTDPDDIRQSTPDFGPIFEFQALKRSWGQTHQNEVCIMIRSVVKFLGAKRLP